MEKMIKISFLQKMKRNGILKLKNVKNWVTTNELLKNYLQCLKNSFKRIRFKKGEERVEQTKE